jgi:hypothetical protein
LDAIGAYFAVRIRAKSSALYPRPAIVYRGALL